ncbi:MAG: cysteine desulfurase [Eggerthellaceae bacterium]|nr:cysteine desulfurase [Eggerthellaceae bacterium]
MESSATEEIYLDNAATTRPYDEVIEVMADVMSHGFGNASAPNVRGEHAKKVLEDSRKTLAEALRVEPCEVFFTSGGTESNNLAILGAAAASPASSNTVVTSAIEHPSVTKSVRELKRSGWNAKYVPAERGYLDFECLEKTLDGSVALITMMSVNNEAGFILPIKEVVSVGRELSPNALIHTDAVQCFGKIPFYPNEIGVDLASLSGHKMGGPQGIGAIYVRKNTRMFTRAFGGGQERGLRSGTEPIGLIAGYPQAAETRPTDLEGKLAYARELKDHLLAQMRMIFEDMIILSDEEGSPYITCVILPGYKNTDLLNYLNSQNISLAKASACSSLHPEVPEEIFQTKHPSSLISAGVPESLLESTIRISLSQRTTKSDIDGLICALANYREIAPENAPH